MDIVNGGYFRCWRYQTNLNGASGNYSSTFNSNGNNTPNMLYCNRETRDKPQLLFRFMINQFKKMENINKVLEYLTMCPWYMIQQRESD